MTAASHSLATALWKARFASGLLMKCYTTSWDTILPRLGLARKAEVLSVGLAAGMDALAQSKALDEFANLRSALFRPFRLLDAIEHGVAVRGGGLRTGLRRICRVPAPGRLLLGVRDAPRRTHRHQLCARHGRPHARREGSAPDSEPCPDIPNWQTQRHSLGVRRWRRSRLRCANCDVRVSMSRLIHRNCELMHIDVWRAQ